MATQDQWRRRWEERSSYWVTVSDETRPEMRHVSPSAARNAPPITTCLAERLPGRGRALEVGSGTGQHVVAFATRFPAIEWTPSDPHPAARASIAAWIEERGLANVHAPLDLDVSVEGWETAVKPGQDALVAINLLHITPWSAAEGLLRGAARLLKPGGLVCLYGCFRRGDRHLSEDNAAFDRSLKHRDPAWGVRDVDEVAAAAGRHALALSEVIEMPAANLMLVLTRADGA